VGRVLFRTERVAVARPSASDEGEVVDAVLHSAALHHPWVAPPGTSEQYRAYLQKMRKRDHHGFLARRIDDGAIVAIVNINSVVFGAFWSGYLGYYAFSGQERQGLMTETLNGIVQYAFGPLGLHRLEANIQPGNAPSIRLAERCGFRLEGYSPEYLKVDGKWRDHERWAKTADAD
jgi:ribosomal-protein-alanine N-acetyltransferase